MSVTRKADTITPYVKQVRAELQKLKRLEVHVGVLGSADGLMLKIAYVHEYGATIKPKTARNLAIPLKPALKGKSPRDVDDTWVLDNGENRFIVRDMGKDRLEFLFLLLPSVTIPERSFIRAGYDGNKDLIAEACSNAVARVIKGELTADQAAHNIGVACSSMIKKYMRTVQPPKSSITLASAPGKTVPLQQSGSLRDSITYEVTSNG